MDDNEPSPDMTPTPDAVSPPIQAAPEPAPEPAKAEAPPAPTPQPVATRDFEAELAMKDRDLKGLEQKLSRIEGASKAAQDERQKLMSEVARLVNEREAIEQAKNEQLEQKTRELEEVSQATQTLAQKAQTLEQELISAQAKATKYEILTNEFPQLLRYAGSIPESADPDRVRAACAALQQAREADLAEYRQTIGQGARPVATPTPILRNEPITDVSALEARLNNAMKSGDPRLFEEEVRAAIANYDARRP